MSVVEISSFVKILSTNRTDALGFGSSHIRPMIGGVYEVTSIEAFGKDKMLRLKGMWIAQKDCSIFKEETLESINPPTLVFDINNLT